MAGPGASTNVPPIEVRVGGGGRGTPPIQNETKLEQRPDMGLADRIKNAELSNEAAFQAEKKADALRQMKIIESDMYTELLEDSKQYPVLAKGIMENAQDDWQQHASSAAQLIREYGSAKVNPARIYQNASGAANFGAALNIAVGQMAGILTGSGNTALSIIDRAVERDIAAQQFNINIKGKAVYAEQQMMNLIEAHADNELERLQLYGSLKKQALYDEFMSKSLPYAASAEAAAIREKVAQRMQENLLAITQISQNARKRVTTTRIRSNMKNAKRAYQIARESMEATERQEAQVQTNPSLVGANPAVLDVVSQTGLPPMGSTGPVATAPAMGQAQAGTTPARQPRRKPRGAVRRTAPAPQQAATAAQVDQIAKELNLMFDVERNSYIPKEGLTGEAKRKQDFVMANQGVVATREAALRETGTPSFAKEAQDKWRKGEESLEQHLQRKMDDGTIAELKGSTVSAENIWVSRSALGTKWGVVGAPRISLEMLTGKRDDGSFGPGIYTVGSLGVDKKTGSIRDPKETMELYNGMQEAIATAKKIKELQGRDEFKGVSKKTPGVKRDLKVLSSKLGSYLSEEDENMRELRRLLGKLQGFATNIGKKVIGDKGSAMTDSDIPRFLSASGLYVDPKKPLEGLVYADDTLRELKQGAEKFKKKYMTFIAKPNDPRIYKVPQ